VATLIVKRSVVLNGAKTSVSLENKFWDGLQEIALNATKTGVVYRLLGNAPTAHE
jgi:predicted DNA-binding ribbon-helix-helix protein